MQVTRSQSITIALSAITLFFAIGYGFVKNDARGGGTEITAAERERLQHFYQGSTPTLASTPKAQKVPVTQPTLVASGSPSTPVQANNEAVPEANLKFGRFQRSETKDGKKLWEVIADVGEYFPQSSSAKLQGAKLWFYRPDGTTVQLEAGEATIFFDGVSLVRAQGAKKVHMVYNDKVTIDTESALYDKEHSKVSAPGHATITSESLFTEGEGLDVDIEHKSASLLRNVSSTVFARTK